MRRKQAAEVLANIGNNSLCNLLFATHNSESHSPSDGLIFSCIDYQYTALRVDTDNFCMLQTSLRKLRARVLP